MRRMERVAFALIWNGGWCFGLVKPIFNGASNVLFYIIIMKRGEIRAGKREMREKEGWKEEIGEGEGVFLLSFLFVSFGLVFLSAFGCGVHSVPLSYESASVLV